MRLIDADALKKDLICFYPEGAPEWLKTKVEEAERERSQTNDR